MGLDTTHNAWHGPYSSFNNFRRAVLLAYNGTDLFEYAGYEMRCKKDLEKESPKIDLTSIDDDGILLLMDHSDCDGVIRWVDCYLVCNSLMKLKDKINHNFKDRLIQFAKGCELAYIAKEDLEFH